LDELGVYERIILKCILKKQDMKLWTGFIWLGTRSNGEFF
jgi:hypothetical protein